jgi:hypothetical protein
MKKVYVITCMIEASNIREFTLSDVLFVFTSEKKANTQLNIIKKEAVNGKWWSDECGKPLYGRVLSDHYIERNEKYLRDVIIENPNGIKELYRITKLELNSGYNINF